MKITFRGKWLIILMILCLAAGTASAGSTDPDGIMGVLNGATYENAILGLGCMLEGWHYYTEEEIRETNRQALELADNDTKALLESNQSVIIMCAESPTGLQNVNINVQNIKNAKVMLDLMGIDAFIDSQIDILKSSYEGSGFSDVQMEKTEALLGTQRFTAIRTTYKISGIPAYMLQVCDARGNYFFYITAVSFVTDQTENTLAHFYDAGETAGQDSGAEDGEPLAGSPFDRLYEGKTRRITFRIPSGWDESPALSSALEVKFRYSGESFTQIHYGVADILSSTGLTEDERGLVTSDMFSEEEIKQLILSTNTLTDPTVEKITSGPVHYFIARNSYFRTIMPYEMGVIIENGYYHSFFLFVSKEETLPQREAEFLETVSSFSSMD